MTTLAKIEANQRNGQLSTGPRTAEGKAAVARNATKHGIFSSVPVLSGEDPIVWAAHRAGVVESLDPVGLLEVNLAERAALLLWRLQRLARYEAETVAAAMEEVEIPSLPPPVNLLASSFPAPIQKTRNEQLRDIRAKLRRTRQELVEVVAAQEFFTTGAGESGVVPFAVVATILSTGLERIGIDDDLRIPPLFDSKAFLKKLGLTETTAEKVTWTLELIRCGLSIYARFAQTPTEPFIEAVQIDVQERVEENTRMISRLEREEGAIVRLLDNRTARRQAAKLLPGDGRDERIAKYERHLHSLLTSTLHELERLQARRQGEDVPPPTMADVNVTVDTRSG
jgi:hypothetical protein